MAIDNDRKAGRPWVATRPAIFLLFSTVLFLTGLFPAPGFHIEEFTVRVWSAYVLIVFATPIGLLIVAAHWSASGLVVFSLVCLLEKLQLGNR